MANPNPLLLPYPVSTILKRGLLAPSLCLPVALLITLARRAEQQHGNMIWNVAFSGIFHIEHSGLCERYRLARGVAIF